MDIEGLREHILHLSGGVEDQELLVRAVRLLERGVGKAGARASFAESDDSEYGNQPRRDTTQYDMLMPDPHEANRTASQMLFSPIDFGIPHDQHTPTHGENKSDPQEAVIQVPSGDVAASALQEDPLGKKETEDETGTPKPEEGALDTSMSDRPRRRIAVSAMPVNIEKLTEYVPRVIEKNPEESAAVRKGVTESHLFSTMEPDEQEVIVKAMEKKQFESGSSILEEGKPPTGYFYMIGSGTCEVTKLGKYVATLTPGATFGELEMIYNIAECSASITTVTACTMWCLDQESYQNIVLKVSMRKRTMFEEALKHVSFLESLSDYDKMTLAEALETKNFDDGNHIISFGEKGRWMYIILEGTVKVLGRDKGAKKEIVTLKKGDVVGELEFLFGHLAVADVVANNKVKTARINKEHFEKCMGPVTDELKRFVAKKGNYTHYLHNAADDSVKKQINVIEKRVKRTAEAGETLANIDENGEVVLIDKNADDVHKEKDGQSTLFRFPLQPIQQGNPLLMVGLRENGTIVSWNEAMENVTNYTANEAIGRSFYGYLLNEQDQKKLHDAVQTAIRFAGNIEGFKTETDGKEKTVFTFQRSDGLTRSQLQFTIVPPSVAHKNVSEMLLAVGTEVKKAPPQRQTADSTRWLLDNIRKEFASTDSPSLEEKKKNIENLMTQFENKSEGLTEQSAQNLRVVNVRQLIGQILMDYSANAIERGHAISQNFEDCYVEEVYCDAKLLPECLRYAMSNCVNHLKNADIHINVAVEEECGAEVLQINFTDNGPGIPSKIMTIFNDRNAEKEIAMTRVRKAVESQGGSMRVNTSKDGTAVVFSVPFIPAEDDTAQEGMSMSQSSVSGFKKQTFTTCVVEESAVHRNMLCALLWERKHAVLPGYNISDVHRLKEVTDVLFIDPQQNVLDTNSTQDPFAELRALAKEICIVITCEGFNDSTREAYHQAGFLTLNKPCTAMQAVTVLRKAEERSAKMKRDLQQVAALREKFDDNQNRGEWKKGKLLGKGSFGEVYEALDVLTGGKMAVKIMRTKTEAQKAEIITEIEVMRTLRHQNIIHYFYAKENEGENTITVFMEYAGGGTVQDLLKDRGGKLDTQEYVRILAEIVDGVAYTHSMRFVHCDLKTANVLLTNEGKCKIGDFGTAKQLATDSDELYVMQGTPIYMAPECMSATNEEGEETVGYSFPADIWSLGCIALEMATGTLPFSYVKEMQGPMGPFKYITSLQDVPDLSPLFDFPPSYIEFVSACLQPDPTKRPTANQLKSFSLFNEEGDTNVKDALKAMKRAQLLHVLNKFVAFQDPEDEEHHAAKKDAGRRAESNFFDSSDDEEEDSEDDVPVAAKKIANAKDKEAAFFDSDEEEEEEEEEEEDTKSPPTAMSAGKPSPGPSKPQTPAAEKVVAAPNRPIFAITRGSSKQNQNSRPMSPQALNTSAPHLVPHPPSDTERNGEPRPTIHHTTSGTSSGVNTIVGSAMETSVGSTTSTIRGDTGSTASMSVSEQNAVVLHDALLSLMDALKLNVNDNRNGLLQQYRDQLKKATPPAPPSTGTASAAAGQQPQQQPFKPNVNQLLISDAEMLNAMAKELREKTPAA